MTGGRIRSWAARVESGRPISLSAMNPIAPVEYIPAATMNSVPTVSTPEFEKPLRLASRGAMPSVTLGP